MIRVNNIGVLRDDWIFQNISFELPQGKLFGIIGDSGSGKTTLLKAISGFVDIVEGAVFLDDRKLIGPTEKLVAGYEEIQLVNQDFELDTFHTVAENIKEKVLHLPKKDQQVLVQEMLDLLELNHISDRQVKWISGGEQQRVSIARALACEPRYLLLDEPFVHLDQQLRLKVMDYLKSLNAVRNTTIVLVSHDGAEMMGFVDEVMHLSKGGVQRIASAADMYYHPEDKLQGALMGMINEISLDGEKILFRPSEYTLDEANMNVTFQSYFDTGLVVFSYFTTDKNERIVLSSMKPINDVNKIRILKHS
ncbi:MAG: ABC transporter ATP-binding protein [Crocinitomicaceae bacterium]